jgi:hypothetical protein
MTSRCKQLQAIDNGEYQKNKKKFELSKNDWNISGDKKNLVEEQNMKIFCSCTNFGPKILV